MITVPNTIGEILRPVLALQADRLALVAPDRSLTYAELDAEADRAAGALVALGVCAGDRVAVSLPNDTRIVVLFHAAMRVGAVWVGVNRALAGPERHTITAHSRARVLIGGTAGDAPAGTRMVSESDWSALVTAAEPVSEHARVDPHAPAGIAYTSGTTGRPKGVVHSQHNLLVPGAVLIATRGWNHTMRKADCLPMTILNMQVLSTLTTCQAGATAVISDARDARRIVAWLGDHRPHVWNGVPSMLYDMARDRSIAPDAMSFLDELWSGGDTLNDDIRTAFTAKFGVPILGTYGLTEAPTIVAIDPPSGGNAPGEAGVVLPHLRIVVEPTDLTDQDVGELCVAAATDGPYAGLYTPMLGYLDDPEATAATLRDGVLHTGDIGRVSETGWVSVRDRRKLVIVRGGANIYPAEVEGVIRAFPGVRAVVVTPVPDERLGARVGAVVEVEGDGVNVAALTDHCAAALARYKVPERWHLTVTPLPRNAMGKIDRSGVRELLTT
jgi:long-chain acyl-CoA synthetase